MPSVSSAWWRAAAAIVGGVLVACAFPPFDVGLLMWPGVILLIVALRGARPRTAAVLGWLFGTAFMLVLLRWVMVFDEPGAYVALAAVEGLFYAAFGAAFCVLSRSRWWPLLGACAWMGIEMLRSFVPFGGFVWGRLAFAAVDTPLVSVARWLGVAALSGAVFGTAALVVWGAERWREADLRWRRAGAAGVTLVLVVGITAVLPVGLTGEGRRMQVAVIQGDVPGTGAEFAGEQREVLSNHVRETQEYAGVVAAGDTPAPDLVLWPENASDIDPITDESAGDMISAAARDVGAPILVGAILDGPDDDTAYNAGIVWDPVTGPGQRYVKQHLVPWGEYVPMRDLSERLVPRLRDEIPRDMLAGDESGALEIDGGVVGTMMCFDVVFDRLARSAVLDGADMLVVQTNNATFTGTAQPEQQWEVARVRAVEAGRTVAVPSTNGISGFIGPDGTAQQVAPVGEPAWLAQEVRAATGVTTGTRLGGWIELAALLVALAAVVVLARAGVREP